MRLYTDPKDPGTKFANGSESFHTPGPFNMLSKVKNCPVAGKELKFTAQITGQPDTWFSIPAQIQYKKKTVRGYVTSTDEGYCFVPYFYCKNYYVLNT